MYVHLNKRDIRFVFDTNIFLGPVVRFEDLLVRFRGAVGDEHDGSVTLRTLAALVHLRKTKKSRFMYINQSCNFKDVQ